MTLSSKPWAYFATRWCRGAVVVLAAVSGGLLAGCQHPAAPEDAALSAALNDYLRERGQLCLDKTRWPIDVTQHEVDVGARNALQMPVLERLGLVSSSVADVAIVDDGTQHHMKVRRYALSDSGRRYYHRRPARMGATGITEGDFCVAQLSLDRIVGSKLESHAAEPRAVVTFTYRVEAAPWTGDAEAQKVFPMVAGVVHGAGTAQLEEAFKKMPGGWVAVDLPGS